MRSNRILITICMAIVLLVQSTFMCYADKEISFAQEGMLNEYSAEPAQSWHAGAYDYQSNLPVVYIDTRDHKTINSKKEYMDAYMYIQGSEDCADQYQGAVEIKGRGNLSWQYPKKPYKIKLSSKSDLFGMGANKHWVLLANYLDESLVRNTVASELSQELGLCSMSTVWVDVVLNGAYVGNYQLCEQIRIGSTRVDVFDYEDMAEEAANAIYENQQLIDLKKSDKSQLEELMVQDLSWITSNEVKYKGTVFKVDDYYQDIPADLTQGYLFESSSEYDELSKFKTATSGYNVMSLNPEYLYTNDEMFGYVKELWNSWDEAICSIDGYDKNGTHYSEIADFQSMIGYWLTMEIMGNNDAVYKSRYAYKGEGLLTFGPAWDFDWGCGSSKDSAKVRSWKVTKNHEQSFFKEWVDDPYFMIKAREKYWEVREYLEELTEDGGRLDSYYEYLTESARNNVKLWFYNRGFFGSTGDAALFKKYMQERIAWLDDVFATDASAIASVKNCGSRHPYTASGDKLKLNYDGAELSITANDSNTSKVSVYVNGIRKATVYVNGKGKATESVAQKKVSVPLTEEDFTEEGTANVINVIGFSETGSPTYQNYLTVAAGSEEPAAKGDGTPYTSTGEYNVKVPHVVVNQAYGGGKKESYSSHSFIELYNQADHEVDLTGWSLQYRSSTNGDQSDSWVKVDLEGKIKAKGYYLVRCGSVKNPTGGITIEDYDLDWNQALHTKGISVLLKSDNVLVPADADVYDNTDKVPAISNYVDLFAVAGNDKTDEQKPPFYEGKLSDTQSKKKTLRRVNGKDSDDNSKDGDFEVIDYSDSSAVPPHSSSFSTAQYTVTWKFYNGTEEESRTETYDYGAMPEFPEEIPERVSTDGNDYVFVGWLPTIHRVTEDAEYKARYAKSSLAYKVILKYNNNQPDHEFYTVFDEQVQDPGTPVRDGHTFTGWYTDKQCTEKWDFSRDTMPAGNLTLYAGWSVNLYTVVFKNGDTVLQTSTIAYGSMPKYTGKTPTKASTPQYSYSFSGWDKDIVRVSQDEVYNAVFEQQAIKYTVKFDVQNHGAAPANQRRATGELLEEPKDPSAASYRFDGWFKEKQCINAWDFSKDVMSSCDMVLYAKWTYQKDSKDESGSKGGGSSTGGSSTTGGSGSIGGSSSGPKVSSGSAGTFSGFWQDTGNGIWKITNNGQYVTSAWVCDDAVTANGQNVWYLMNTDGTMLAAGLVQDNTGNFYSLETTHNGYYGSLRYKSGYYDCNGHQVYLEFSQKHDGTFGAVTNADGLAKLKEIYGITKFGIGNDRCQYTSTFR